MNKLLAAIDAYMLRLYGIHADLSDPQRIPICYAVIDGYEYELFCDATAPAPLVTDIVDGEVTEVSHLIDTDHAAAWFDEADRDEVYAQACDAVKSASIESRRAG